MSIKTKKTSGFLKMLINVFLGAFIGVGAILPGLSGGVMCVVFGVYEPLMETLAKPFSSVKKHWKLLIPIVAGIAIGFVGFSKVLDNLLDQNTLLMQSIFVGLILGTFPALWKEAGAEKRKASSWLTLVISFVALFLLFSILGSNGDDPTQMSALVGKAFPIGNINITPNFFWFVVCGVICGISIIVPGMSFSSPLMCLGLFDDMTEKLKSILDLNVSVLWEFLLPFGIGGVATVFLLAKPVNWLFHKYNSIAYHIVVGAVLASTILLVPFQFESIQDCLYCLAGLFGGLIVGYVLDIIQSKVKVE